MFFFYFFSFFFFFPISFILCSYTLIGLIALTLAHYIVYCPLWIGDSMPLCFPLVSSHELHSVHTVFLFGCFVNHVPYIHTYEHVRHQPPIDYLLLLLDGITHMALVLTFHVLELY